MSDITLSLFMIVVVSLTFVIYGIVLCMSKKVVKFYDYEDYTEEEIKDVKGWNTYNGLLWVCYGLYFLLIELCIFSMVSNPVICALLAFIAAIIPIFVITRMHDKFVEQVVSCEK